METELSNGKLITWQPSKQLSRWIGEQLTIVAEGCGESLTQERMEIYAADLQDIEPARLATAFTRARRELKFFPKIAELRELAGANAEDRRQIEADAAWQFAIHYLERHGVVKYDLDSRPALPLRVEYALRRIGGLWGLNQMTSESRPFMYRDFCEGYNQAPAAEVLAPQLAETFCASKVLGEVQRLNSEHTQVREIRSTRCQPLEAKPIPAPLTVTQVRDRREKLHQQAESLFAAKVKGS